GAEVLVNRNSAVHSALGEPRVGIQLTGALGVIVEGPAGFGGGQWWRVDFTSGEDGWVRVQTIDAK
ncbi:MAG: hypothetical protein HC850_18590, partial [Rhodomicrobium sp.]|nr:hypothetical protein [Rhodomicrobium sp.]